jgi:beta-lactamase regulating signal transducer with metallopeptidase domain
MDTLTSLFDWVLVASGRASLLMMVVLLVQILVRHRVPAGWVYGLWLPVLMVLLIPVLPESSWSVSSITQTMNGPVPEHLVMGRSATGSTVSEVLGAIEAGVPIPWRKVLCLVWLGGVVGLVLIGIAAYTLALVKFQSELLPMGDGLRNEVVALAREVGLRRAPPVWVASAIRSPAVTGLLCPVMLLPAKFEELLVPHEARLVIKHELMHIRRGDLMVNALLCLLLAVHWFNPLLWLAFFRARLDREAACDAQVLDRVDQTQRVFYGHTLLKVEAAFSHRGRSFGYIGIFQRGMALRMRIQSIATAKQSHPHPLMKTVFILCLALLTFLGITKAAPPDNGAAKIQITAKFVEISEKDPRLADSSPWPAPLDDARKLPRVVGVFSDPQFQLIIRSLSQRKGVDMMSAPSVTARSGQAAKVEVVREFVYPAGAMKTDTMDVGVILEAMPKLTAGNRIALHLRPQVVEFEGFQPLNGNVEVPEPVVAKKILHDDGTITESINDGDRGVVSQSKYDASGVLTARTTIPSSQQKPIFTKRRADVDVVVTSGETMILEMESRTDRQTVQENDGADRVVSSKTERIQRRLFVFVTAKVTD